VGVQRMVGVEAQRLVKEHFDTRGHVPAMSAAVSNSVTTNSRAVSRQS